MCIGVKDLDNIAGYSHSLYIGAVADNFRKNAQKLQK